MRRRLPAPPPGFPPGADSDENDDAVDAVDRIDGADGLPVTAARNDDLFAPPSQPIATQRLREGDPALVGEKPQNHPVFVVEIGRRRADRSRSAGRTLRPAVLALVRRELVGPQHRARRRPVHPRHEPAAGDRGDPRRRRALVPAARPRHPRRQVERPAHDGRLARHVRSRRQPASGDRRACSSACSGVACCSGCSSVSAARLLVFAGLDAGLGEALWTYVILGVGFVARHGDRDLRIRIRGPPAARLQHPERSC